MKTSLFSRILSDNDQDAARLDAWLAERDAERALRATQTEDLPFSVDGERLGKAAAPHDGDVRPGQIRILSPGLVADGDAVPYVAVLDHWMGNLWLVAPFSPYNHPASNGEMETGDRLAGRRVLQCWNARTAHESLVAQSYVAGSLDESVRADALALFRHVAAGTPLPETFSAPVGAPVLSKADPRGEFLSESATRFAPLTAAARALEAKLALAERLAAARDRIKEWFEKFRVPVCGTPAYALAAGDKAKETTETFVLPAFGVELDVKHAPDEGKIRLVVYGPGGERSTKALEGFVVADREGSAVGVLEGGVLVADASVLAGGFLLLDPESLEPVALERKGK